MRLSPGFENDWGGEGINTQQEVRYHNGSHIWLCNPGHAYKAPFNSLRLGRKDPNKEWTSNVTFTRSARCDHCKKGSRILEAKGQRAAWYRCCGRPA